MIVELDDLRDWLEVGDNSDDAIIEQLEAAAQQIVQNYTGSTFAAAGEVVEFVYGLGTSELFLIGNPTADPTEVLERAAVGDVGTEITASDGWVRRGSRLLRKGGGVWTKGAEYEVTYAGTSAPEDVRNAVVQIVGILYRGRGKEGMRTETAGPSYSYDKETEAIQEVLKPLPYRPVFA